MSKTPIADDEAVIWKSDTVKIGKKDGMVMFFMFCYHTVKGDYHKSWYECFFRIDTEENWNNLINGIAKENPADFFRLKDIGINEKGDYRIFYARRHLMKTEMTRFLRLKFNKKTKKLKKFIEEQDKLKGTVAVYPKIYEGIDVINETDKIEHGKWYNAPRIKTLRKRDNRIIY